MDAAYQNYVNSYVVKPVDFEKFAKLLVDLGYYWLAWNRHPWPDKAAGQSNVIPANGATTPDRQEA